MKTENKNLERKAPKEQEKYLSATVKSTVGSWKIFDQFVIAKVK